MATREAQQYFANSSEDRRRWLSEMLSQRQVPLNEIAALMSGSQVQNPFAMLGYAQNANAQPAPIFGAGVAAGDWVTGLYNAQAAQRANMQSGLFGLGAMGMMAMSDRRLKSNIVRLGDHPLGIGWYEYDIFGQRTQGVMADDVRHVRPEAVLRHPSGYDMVDYGRLA
jgi:hypothetical protein